MSQQSSIQLSLPSQAKPVLSHGVKVVVTGTGFSTAEKQALVPLVQYVGCAWLGDFVQKTSTVLVCKRVIDAVGTPKYIKALEWGVPIISYTWILDSLAAGKLLPHADYKTDKLDERSDVQQKLHQVAMQLRIPLATISHASNAHATVSSTASVSSQHDVPPGMQGMSHGAASYVTGVSRPQQSQQLVMQAQHGISKGHGPKVFAGDHRLPLHESVGGNKHNNGITATSQQTTAGMPSASTPTAHSGLVYSQEDQYSDGTTPDFSFGLLARNVKKAAVGAQPSVPVRDNRVNAGIHGVATGGPQQPNSSRDSSGPTTPRLQPGPGHGRNGVAPTAAALLAGLHDCKSVVVSPLPSDFEFSTASPGLHECMEPQATDTTPSSRHCCDGSEPGRGTPEDASENFHSSLTSSQQQLLESIPPSPGAGDTDSEDDSIIIPGTQAVDDDDDDDDDEDLSTPQSLISYLQRKSTFGGTAAGPGHGSHFRGMPTSSQSAAAAAVPTATEHQGGSQDTITASMHSSSGHGTGRAGPSASGKAPTAAQQQHDSRVQGPQPAEAIPCNVTDCDDEDIIMMTSPAANKEYHDLTSPDTDSIAGALSPMAVSPMPLSLMPGCASSQSMIDSPAPPAHGLSSCAGGTAAPATQHHSQNQAAGGSKHLPPVPAPPRISHPLYRHGDRPVPMMGYAHGGQREHAHDGGQQGAQHVMHAARMRLSNLSTANSVTQPVPAGMATEQGTGEEGPSDMLVSPAQPFRPSILYSGFAHNLGELSEDGQQPDSQHITAQQPASTPAQDADLQDNESRVISKTAPGGPPAPVADSAAQQLHAMAIAGSQASQQPQDVNQPTPDNTQGGGLPQQGGKAPTPDSSNFPNSDSRITRRRPKGKAANFDSPSIIDVDADHSLITPGPESTAVIRIKPEPGVAAVTYSGPHGTMPEHTPDSNLGSGYFSHGSDSSYSHQVIARGGVAIDSRTGARSHVHIKPDPGAPTTYLQPPTPFPLPTTTYHLPSAPTTYPTFLPARPDAQQAFQQAFQQVFQHKAGVAQPRMQASSGQVAASSGQIAAAASGSAAVATGNRTRAGVLQPARSAQIKQEQWRMAARPSVDSSDTLTGSSTGLDNDDDDFQTPAPTTASSGTSPVEHLQQQLARATATAAPVGLSPSALSVTVLKAMGRAPRNTTAREHHRLVSLKGIEFVEQVQLDHLQLALNCKERSKQVTCALVVMCNHLDGRSAACAAEPLAFYKLPNGEWWMEFSRMYSARDLRVLAAAAGEQVQLPADFLAGTEVMQDNGREHCRLAEVRGSIAVVRSKKAPSGQQRGRSRSSSGHLVQRYVFDAAMMVVLTNEPASSFVVDK